MKAFISGGLNATLQTWDQHAAAAVYPPGSAPPIPTGVTATGATSVGVSWNTSTGATSYQVYRQALLNGAYTAACTATAPTISCTDSPVSANTAYLYSVRALNGATPSAMTTLSLTTGGWTDNSLTGVIVKAVHFSEIRTRMR